MVKAPLPEHFSEELLLQALLRIQNQPSLYDLFLERLTEQFTIGQYERLVSTWTRYCNSLGEGMASQNAFLRQLSERLTVHLETQKRSASLEVDIDDENLRGSRVRHERWQLWEPLQKQKTPRDEAQEEILSREEQKKRIQEEIGTKEAQLAELDENSSRAELLKDDLSKLDGLLREVNKKIFSLRKQHGI
jgi:hypothetical protein